jgi:hypothetical protein
METSAWSGLSNRKRQFGQNDRSLRPKKTLTMFDPCRPQASLMETSLSGGTAVTGQG